MSLFNELKRRNVIRVAAAYLIIGWLLAQVSSTLEAALNLPPWFDTLIVTIMLIGFPIALIISWVYELTPEGIKKDKDIKSDETITHETGKKLNYITLVAAIAVAGMFVWQQFSSRELDSRLRGNDDVVVDSSITNNNSFIPYEEGISLSLNTISAPQNNTIAVLPFADMSPNKDQEYFSDGISEEILNVLAKIPELQITSRTSAFSFKGTKSDLKAIAKILGVANILEGSIRKSGTKVRITAQLIDTRTDKHLWSETYDRELTNIFKIQDEISLAIVEALKETLGLKIKNQDSTAKVINPEAYDWYLKGLQQYKYQTFSLVQDSIQSYQKALEIEPDFSLAKIQLANSYLTQYTIGSISDPNTFNQAKDLLKQVLLTDPNSSQAHFVLSKFSYSQQDRESQLKEIERAYQLDPNNADIIVMYVRMKLRESNQQTIDRLFNRALKLDPLNPEIPSSIARFYRGYPHSRQKAAAYINRAKELDPNNANYNFFLGHLYGYSYGDIVKSIDQFHLTTMKDKKDPDPLIYLSRSYYSLGDPDKALEYANQALIINPNSADANVSKIAALILKGDNTNALNIVQAAIENPKVFHRDSRSSKKYLMALGVHLLLEKKDYVAAKALIEYLAPGTEQLLTASAPKSIKEVGNTDALELLVVIFRAEGRQQNADQLASRLHLILEQPKIIGQYPYQVFYEIIYAEAAVSQQKYQLALDHLISTINDGNILNWRTKILYNPIFSGLQNEPRYKDLINRLESEMTRQRVIIKNTDNKINQHNDN